MLVMDVRQEIEDRRDEMVDHEQELVPSRQNVPAVAIYIRLPKQQLLPCQANKAYWRFTTWWQCPGKRSLP